MTEIPKITELEIEGFRSFKKTVWKPGNLNIVIGKNGSGKTNLLKALELLSHCAKGGLADYISDSGGMNALLWDGKLYKFSFKILVKELLDFEPLTGSYSILLDNTPSTSGFRVAKETFSDLAKIYGDVILERTGVRLKYYNASEGQFYEPSIKNGHVREEAILSYPIMAFPSIPPSYNEFIDFLKGWTIYQSINTDQNSQIRREAEVRNVAQIAPDGQNLINVLHSLYQSPESPDF
jgi:predicted ATPase